MVFVPSFQTAKPCSSLLVSILDLLCGGPRLKRKRISIGYGRVALDASARLRTLFTSSTNSMTFPELFIAAPALQPLRRETVRKIAHAWSSWASFGTQAEYSGTPHGLRARCGKEGEVLRHVAIP